MTNNKGKYIIIREDGNEYYRDDEDKLIILDDLGEACSMIGMSEVDGYVCEIKYHHKEDEMRNPNSEFYKNRKKQ